MRINKFLAESGVCSRRAADKLIEEGAVKVNGKICVIGQDIDEFSDSVFVGGTSSILTLRSFSETAGFVVVVDGVWVVAVVMVVTGAWVVVMTFVVTGTAAVVVTAGTVCAVPPILILNDSCARTVLPV